MEQQNMPSTTSQSEAPVTLKLPYAPPQATFVPLKLEERLLACAKVHGMKFCSIYGEKFS
jgi:hypothetical protein